MKLDDLLLLQNHTFCVFFTAVSSSTRYYGQHVGLSGGYFQEEV